VAIYKVSPSAQRDLVDIYIRGFRELREYCIKTEQWNEHLHSYIYQLWRIIAYLKPNLPGTLSHNKPL